MKNKNSDLRNHLFAMLERLNDDVDKPTAEDIEAAKAMSIIAGNIIKSSKLDLDAAKIMMKSDTKNNVPDFFENKLLNQ